MSKLSIVIPTMNRAGYLTKALDSLQASIANAGADGAIDIVIFDNYSKDDTASVGRNLADKYENVSYRLQSRESASAEESAFLALSTLSGEASADYFWLFGDDDLATEDACAKILETLRAGYDFVLAGLRVMVGDGVEHDYYSMVSNGVGYASGRDLFRDFGLATATTTLSCLAGRLSSIDFDVWNSFLSISPIYSHSLAFLCSYRDRPCAVLSGAQVRYTFNSVDDELSRLKAGGVTLRRWTLWPYSEGLRSLIGELVLNQMPGEVRLIEEVEEIHLSKESFNIVHGTFVGFMYQMYLNQASLYVREGQENEHISEDSVDQLSDLVSQFSMDESRQTGWYVCEFLRGLRHGIAADDRLLQRAMDAVYQLQQLTVSERFGENRKMVLETRSGVPIKPLRGYPF